LLYRSQNVLQRLVTQDIGRGDPQHGDAARSEPDSATLVVPHSVGGIMRQPVHLNSQPRRGTIKVEDVGPDRGCRRNRNPASRRLRNA